MTGLNLTPEVVPASASELIEYPDDKIWIRSASNDDMQVIEYWSTDRQGPPMHSHPWDEIELVIEGAAQFKIGDGDWTDAPQGSVQVLPKGIAHSVRIPQGEARIVMVTVGAPFAGFGRDMARMFAAGAGLAEIAETAARHGVRLG